MTDHPSTTKFRQLVELKDFRPPTKKEYVRYVRRLGDHFQCDPAALSEDQLRAYFLFLRQEKKFGGSAMKLARCALRCFFRDGLHVAGWTVFEEVRVAPPQTLPLVLTREQVATLLGALLKEGAGALQDLAADPKHLGAELGLSAVLQTWTRDLRYHPHVHLLVPGGGLTFDQLRWVRVKNAEFLVPQVKLAARFKGRLKRWLQQEQPGLFAKVPAKVWWMKWVADVRPVGTGEAALKYLAAYLCRPPLHESQLEACDATIVTFRYRENDGAVQRATVSGEEFVRRVLQHVLPKGFQRVRHTGWRGGAAQKKWARILALLDWRPALVIAPAPVPPPKCPGCGKPMLLIGTRPRAP